MVQRENHSHFGGSAFFCRNDRGKPADTALFCGHGTPCPYRMCCKIARAVTKTIVQKRNDFRTVCPKRLLQLSAAGEVFSEGEQPSESLSADSEIPVPILLGTRKRWVRKATAFRGRSEQDRSALVSRLLFLDFGNVPVERFQRDIPFPKPADTARRVPTDESYHYFVAEIQNVSRETFFVREYPPR